MRLATKRSIPSFLHGGTATLVADDSPECANLSITRGYVTRDCSVVPLPVNRFAQPLQALAPRLITHHASSEAAAWARREKLFDKLDGSSSDGYALIHPLLSASSNPGSGCWPSCLASSASSSASPSGLPNGFGSARQANMC